MGVDARARLIAALGVLCVGPGAPVVAAPTNLFWLNPVDGQWDDPTKWSGTFLIPNNGQPQLDSTYIATIDAVGGPYEVNIRRDAGDITVDGLILDSPDATARVGSSLFVLGEAELRAGAFIFAKNRSVHGGTYRLLGADVTFEDSTSLHGVAFRDDDPLIDDAFNVRLYNSIDLGDTTLRIRNSSVGFTFLPTFSGHLHAESAANIDLYGDSLTLTESALITGNEFHLRGNTAPGVINNGTIDLNGPGNSWIDHLPESGFTNNGMVSIAGGGTLYLGGEFAVPIPVVNTGTIDVTGSKLSIASNGFLNTGQIDLHDTELTLWQDTFTLSGLGQINPSGDTSTRLARATLDLEGGALDLATSLGRLHNLQEAFSQDIPPTVLRNGTIVQSIGADVDLNYVTLRDLTITGGDVRFGSIKIAGPVGLGGHAALTTGDAPGGDLFVAFQGSQHFGFDVRPDPAASTGGGHVELQAQTGHKAVLDAGTTVAGRESSITFRAEDSGSLDPARFVLKGLVTTQGSSAPARISFFSIYDMEVVNRGRIEASHGASIVLGDSQISNRAEIVATGGATLHVSGADVANRADLTLQDSTARFSVGTFTNEPAGLVEAHASQLYVGLGSTFGGFHNLGRITLDDASVLAFFGSNLPANLAGSTLFDGEWDVLAGSSLDLNSALVTTLSAHVTLSGAASSFAALGALQTITSDASLTLTHANQLATSSSLLVDGTLALGPDASLLLPDDLTLGAHATLRFDIAPGQAGPDATGLVVPAGNAFLDGVLHVTIDPNASVGAGDVFPLISAGAISGDFDRIRLTDGPAGLGAVLVRTETLVSIEFRVPAPGTLGILAAPALAAGRRRRGCRRCAPRTRRSTLWP